MVLSYVFAFNSIGFIKYLSTGTIISLGTKTVDTGVKHGPNSQRRFQKKNLAASSKIHTVVNRSGKMSEESSRPSKLRCCCFWLCTVLSCLVVLLLLAWLIAYMVTVGFGDKEPVQGTRGVCRQTTNSSSSSRSLDVMVFNTFFIYCLPLGLGSCEEEDLREARVGRIAEWFGGRDEDVVLMQEIWSFREDIVAGMTEGAGFCHHTIAGGNRVDGSGLAIFSRHEIIEHDFVDFYDAFGAGSGMRPGAFNSDAILFDKGILYAKIRKDDQFFHLFTTHTMSDFFADEHESRVAQYEVIDGFVESKSIPQDELVILGGDFNEDKYCSENVAGREPVCQDQEYYDTMLDILSAVDPPLEGDLRFTYSKENSYHAGDETETDLLLDYVLYRDDHLIPSDSTRCRIIRALDRDGNDLSDHNPMTCEYRLE